MKQGGASAVTVVVMDQLPPVAQCCDIYIYIILKRKNILFINKRDCLF